MARLAAAVRRLVPRHPWISALLALVALCGALYFAVVVSVIEMLHPMYDPMQRTISELAVGRFGGLQISAFVMLGVSLLALHQGLWRRVRGTPLSRVALVLVGVSGVAAIVAASFPTDLTGAAVTTVNGTVHEVSASVGYACLITGALLLSIHFRRDDRWRSYFRPSLALATAAVAASIFMAVTAGSDLQGLSQRTMAAPLLLWVALTSVKLYRVAPVRVRTGR